MNWKAVEKWLVQGKLWVQLPLEFDLNAVLMCGRDVGLLENGKYRIRAVWMDTMKFYRGM